MLSTFVSDRGVKPRHSRQRTATPKADRIPTGAAPLPRDISVVAVRKSFGATRALDGCNFSASRGEIHAIVGGNGSGKSTLAKVISGVLPPDSGKLSVFGETPSSPHEARVAGIVTVFQEILVADDGSVAENLFLGADHLFSSTIPIREKVRVAEHLMRDMTGMDIDPRTPVAGLPLSVKQWIVIGRALLAEPRTLILDESSAALDLDSTQRLFAKLRELREGGCAILIVSHRITELVQIAERATVLRDGRDVGVLEGAEVTEHNLMSLMTGKTNSVHNRRASPKEDALSNEVMLDVRDLQVWPSAPAFRMQLRRGEILGIAGLDGQGQAEFLRVLAGIDRPVSGYPKGRDASGQFIPVRNLVDATACSIAYVSGDRKREGIFPNLSIFENLLAPRYRRNSRAGWLKVLDRPALASVFEFEADKLAIRMGDRHDRITSLSGGNQQKVLIGRAFAMGPEVLLLNDPARGVDVGAKAELYEQLRDFAATSRAVVYLSSEIEELPGLCHRVLVFRNGCVFEVLAGQAIQPDLILRAMFGQPVHGVSLGGFPTGDEKEDEEFPDSSSKRDAAGSFKLVSTAFADGDVIPDAYVETSKVSPPLSWTSAPSGTRSFALAVTDPDLPEAFNFPRAFAHWMVHGIAADARSLPENASARRALGANARELNSDFVTFRIPGFGRGYGGPWPPDCSHRYIFTLYALKVENLELGADADYPAFIAAVLPVTISSATLIGHYGPAKQALPSA